MKKIIESIMVLITGAILGVMFIVGLSNQDRQWTAPPEQVHPEVEQAQEDEAMLRGDNQACILRSLLSNHEVRCDE